MPQFQIDKKINNIPILENLGIKKAFNLDAEFQGINTDTEYPMHIWILIQKNIINVN